MAVEGIIGIKLGMTQIFAEDGNLVGCTVLQAGPCVVVQRRTKEKDGYDAAQLGLVEFVKPQRVTKALTGHFKKANVAPMKVMREVRLGESKEETKVGDRVLVDGFKAGELVDARRQQRQRFAGGVALALCRRRRDSRSMFTAHRGIGGSSSRHVWKNQHSGHMGTRTDRQELK
jgi:large subunit ribosomal protein L3